MPACCLGCILAGMPRKPRIDQPGLLYHVIARGIERRQIFNDNADRDWFLARLGRLTRETGIRVYAFALIPNHFHLLISRDQTPVAQFMQRLLTAYALYFNRKHRRAGHLFQNRYRSIVCEEDEYLLELVRYINLNPLRAGIIAAVRELAGWPYASHSLIVGRHRQDWYERELVLAFFGQDTKRATRSYQDFIAAEESDAAKADLSGGGLERSLGRNRPRAREKQAYDERVLGPGRFVEGLLADPQGANATESAIQGLIEEVCSEYSVTRCQLYGSSRVQPVSGVRSCLAARMSAEYGLSRREIARRLNVSHTAVAKMLDRNRARGRG